jgi:hypothetical protein
MRASETILKEDLGKKGKSNRSSPNPLRNLRKRCHKNL